ncbi:MAG TPA: sigma-54 dependent transcriptional regulator, partial [Candidatus Angelobacter sp.]|nr:sigma-54 dependent transcriptional regulator [Candidatus Angelobacter sp.]
MASILIVEDEPKMRRLLEISLGEDGHTVRTVGDAENALKGLAREPADLIVTDLKLPGMNGLEFLHEAKRMNAATPVIVMTAYGSVETAVEAMKAGASDYVLKPFTMAEMKLVINKELDVQRVRDENRSLKEALGKRYHFQNIVARSAKMQEVLALVERVAATNSTVLIGGESGVGKDLIARAIHQNSRRASGPFIKINSTAIPDNLFESELFGFEKGAFTGAVAGKPGKFELADKGTLFLDEIGDVPSPIQVKLLRVLQEREFERLGGTKTLKVDVRLIAATNRDLRAALEEGTFREDLYYRLNVVPIDIPPLREHKEDIPELVDHFFARFAKNDGGKEFREITPAGLKALTDYHWPGNVRQLENIIERAMALSSGPVLDVADIHLDLRAPPSPANSGGAPFLPEG